MTAKDIDLHLDWLAHSLHLAAFEPVRRPDGRVDHDFYAARARSARARVVNRALRATSRTLLVAVRRGVLDPVRRWHRVRQTSNELMTLDDRMLDDIGISRDDIEAVARGELRSRARDQKVAVARRELEVEPTQAASAAPQAPKYREAA